MYLMRLPIKFNYKFFINSLKITVNHNEYQRDIREFFQQSHKTYTLLYGFFKTVTEELKFTKHIHE